MQLVRKDIDVKDHERLNIAKYHYLLSNRQLNEALHLPITITCVTCNTTISTTSKTTTILNKTHFTNCKK